MNASTALRGQKRERSPQPHSIDGNQDPRSHVALPHGNPPTTGVAGRQKRPGAEMKSGREQETEGGIGQYPTARGIDHQELVVVEN